MTDIEVPAVKIITKERYEELGRIIDKMKK